MTVAMRTVLVFNLLMLSQALAGTKVNATAKVDATAGTKMGPCDCQSWADVYYSGKADCGRGNELYFLSKWGFSAAYAATEPITGMPHKVCVDFFKNFMTPSCVNVDLIHTTKPTAMADKQWCYVSNDCLDLNGGKYATNQIGFAQGGWHNLESTATLAWKICEPGLDPMTKYWSVTDLIKTAQYSDVSVSRLLRLAFPAVNITYGMVGAFMDAVNDAYSPGLSLAEMVDTVDVANPIWGASLVDAHIRVKSIILSGQATVLDSLGHGDNYHVIEGRSVWEVRRVHNGNMAYLGGHFFDEFKVSCIMGCATGERSGAVDLDTL